MRSVSGTMSSRELSNFLVKDSVNLTDKCAMLKYFSEHFNTAGDLFDSLNSDLKKSAGQNEPAVVSSWMVNCSFHFVPVSEVCNALRKVDSKISWSR